jgi:Fe-S oxidoreductase
MRKMGNEYLYQAMATENIESIKAYGVKKVVTACPHCFNTLAKDYRDLGFDVETEHYTAFLNRLVAEGKLKLKGEAFDCTYHDSCYLGRYNDLYREPRALITAAGGSIREMERSGLVNTQRGRGTFIADIEPPTSGAERRRLLQPRIDALLTEAAHLGLTEEELLDSIRAATRRYLLKEQCGQ